MYMFRIFFNSTTITVLKITMTTMLPSCLLSKFNSQWKLGLYCYVSAEYYVKYYYRMLRCENTAAHSTEVCTKRFNVHALLIQFSW